MISQNTALLLVDVQKGFDEPVWGKRNNPNAEEHMALLLAAWRKYGRPVVHVQHLSTNPTSALRPGYAGSEFKEIVQPMAEELIVQKNVNSAFIGTNLEQELRSLQVDALVIVGLTTPHCVSTTARMAGNLGFRTFVTEDATAAFELSSWDGKIFSAKDVHEAALVALHNEFAYVLSSNKILSLPQFGN